MAEETVVIVKDIRMSFFSMVIFMVKWAVASIPALMILIALAALAGVLFGGVFGGLFGGAMRMTAPM